jgi:hypothetical protein
MSTRTWVLTAAVLLVAGSGARAADPTPIPGYLAPPTGPVAQPYVQSGGTCATCGHGRGGVVSALRGGCGLHGSSCKPTCPTHNKPPYVVNLCPGACFGYFQTQWRRWDEVCPYPYQGTGVSDAARPPSPFLPSPSVSDRPPVDKKGKDGGALPDPRPIDPKTGKPIVPPPSGGLPPIPPPPGNP